MRQPERPISEAEQQAIITCVQILKTTAVFDADIARSHTELLRFYLGIFPNQTREIISMLAGDTKDD